MAISDPVRFTALPRILLSSAPRTVQVYRGPIRLYEIKGGVPVLISPQRPSNQQF